MVGKTIVSVRTKVNVCSELGEAFHEQRNPAGAKRRSLPDTGNQQHLHPK
jgi:hypothetical protein